MNNVTLLRDCVIVRIDIASWTGKAKLTRADIPESVDLPPEDIALLGQKRLINPNTLKEFGKLKTRASRLMDRYGAKFLSGWLVDSQYVNELAGQIGEIKKEYDEARDNFLRTYTDEVESWMQQHPRWRSILDTVIPDPAKMASKFHMGWQMYKIEPVQNDVIPDTTAEELVAVQEKDINELASAVNEIYRDSFKDRTGAVTTRTIKPLRDLADRCERLRAIYPSALMVGEALTTLVSLFNSGRAGAVAIINAALKDMADPHSLRDMVQEWANSGVVDFDNYDQPVPQQEEDTASQVLSQLAENLPPVVENVAPVLPPEQSKSDAGQSLLNMIDDLF